jgi:hypothetical protein
MSAQELFTQAQEINKPQTFTYRTNTSVERVVVILDENMDAKSINYQTAKDKTPIKLNIITKDKENRQITAQNPTTKTKYIFSASWMMGGTLFGENDKTKEFGVEIQCFSPTGEILLTSGGPMFLPFFYAPNAKSPFVNLDVPQEQIGKDQRLPSGENYYEIDFPKKGKYKIAPMPYDETDGNKTKIKLVDAKGKATIFKSK